MVEQNPGLTLPWIIPFFLPKYSLVCIFIYGDGSKPCTPVVHIKIAGKWMFIPLKMVLIGIDPYPYIYLAYLKFIIPMVKSVWNPQAQAVAQQGLAPLSEKEPDAELEEPKARQGWLDYDFPIWKCYTYIYIYIIQVYSICICMYVCMYVCIYIYVLKKCMYTNIHCIYIYIQVNICMYICTMFYLVLNTWWFILAASRFSPQWYMDDRWFIL